MQYMPEVKLVWGAMQSTGLTVKCFGHFVSSPNLPHSPTIPYAGNQLYKFLKCVLAWHCHN